MGDEMTADEGAPPGPPPPPLPFGTGIPTGYQPPQATNTNAIVAICSAAGAWLVCPVIPAIVAIVFARKPRRRSPPVGASNGVETWRASRASWRGFTSRSSPSPLSWRCGRGRSPRSVALIAQSGSRPTPSVPTHGAESGARSGARKGRDGHRRRSHVGVRILRSRNGLRLPLCSLLAGRLTRGLAPTE